MFLDACMIMYDRVWMLLFYQWTAEVLLKGPKIPRWLCKILLMQCGRQEDGYIDEANVWISVTCVTCTTRLYLDCPGLMIGNPLLVAFQIVAICVTHQEDLIILGFTPFHTTWMTTVQTESVAVGINILYFGCPNSTVVKHSPGRAFLSKACHSFNRNMAAFLPWWLGCSRFSMIFVSFIQIYHWDIYIYPGTLVSHWFHVFPTYSAESRDVQEGAAILLAVSGGSLSEGIDFKAWPGPKGKFLPNGPTGVKHIKRP